MSNVEFRPTRAIALVSPPIRTASFRLNGVRCCFFMKHIIQLSRQNDPSTTHRNKSLRIAIGVLGYWSITKTTFTALSSLELFPIQFERQLSPPSTTPASPRNQMRWCLSPHSRLFSLRTSKDDGLVSPILDVQLKSDLWLTSNGSFVWPLPHRVEVSEGEMDTAVTVFCPLLAMIGLKILMSRKVNVVRLSVRDNSEAMTARTSATAQTSLTETDSEENKREAGACGSDEPADRRIAAREREVDRFRRDDRVMHRAGVRDVNDHYCSPFLNWSYNPQKPEHKNALVFRSLVATVKLYPVLDASLEEKALDFLESTNPYHQTLAAAFFNSFALLTDESLTNFVQSIVVLISSTSPVITTAAMEMLTTLFGWCSPNVRLGLVNADLIPQIINTLNPQSFSFVESVDIHLDLMEIIDFSFWLATPHGLEILENEDRNEQLAVRETIFKQILLPSEKYICHLCANCYSIIDGSLAEEFMTILSQILQICTYHKPTIDFVLLMPVFLTIPSCLTFFEDDESNFVFLDLMVDTQREWNKRRGTVREMEKTVHRTLGMEGIDDAIEEKRLNDEQTDTGRWIVEESIEWNNLQGMNIPKQN
ncbi:hypothetical protein BLNAU_17202 [Blattamonas nauphoetae]|uniref:Uncharacterized protein n=1 Tax=Blattamonas nauphoetae TaxID=2049346 RepID=A0ABQ9XB51_9EUKA|nr:hypothetical protein BLNAU_17202 [Blattamonas nauphoetae]